MRRERGQGRRYKKTMRQLPQAYADLMAEAVDPKWLELRRKQRKEKLTNEQNGQDTNIEAAPRDESIDDWFRNL